MLRVFMLGVLMLTVFMLSLVDPLIELFVKMTLLT
jgi:hypothetical protein